MPPSSPNVLLDALRERLGAVIAAERVDAAGQVAIEIRPADLAAACLALRDDESLAFGQLSDLCGVDYLAYGKADWETQGATGTGFSRGVSQGVYISERDAEERFAVVYHLLSLRHNRRLRVRSFVSGNPPRIASVTPIWAGANWFEREAFDLFGILFDDHPDLRRILTDYGFIGHPFRKDFPLEGEREVRYDPERGRVVYQPVTIKNRVLTPKTIRHDDRYAPGPRRNEDRDAAA